MGSGLLFGGTLVASVLAGSIALFAPCCISVMLPAYLAGAFQNRGRRVAMTFLYGVGVATVILPIALGAIVLRQVIFGDHSIVFTTMGVLLLGLGVWVLAGGQLHLPAPGGGKPSRSGPLGVYLLGVASGITTSCCAPVLAGVIALSGTAGSLPAALSVGAAYVFGMVAPLFAVAIIWQQVDPGRFRWFGPRTVSWRLGRWRRTLAGTALSSGVLLLLMGGAVLWTGLSGGAGASPGGWQETLTVWLQAQARTMTSALAKAPGWAVGIGLLVLVAGLAGLAARELGVAPGRRATPPNSPPREDTDA
ncbi:MAG: cytochrome c biogenesis protein CcdA [Candidatus Dormibacteraeota bacterium]|nr:cytochrome c biogenesis protein CcdA [Candidatus Dormibacteraeota bacterium]